MSNELATSGGVSPAPPPAPLTPVGAVRRPDFPPRWPSALRSSLEAEHSRLRARTAAESEIHAPVVLDLSLADDRQRVVAALGAAGRVGGGTVEGGPFDVVLSVAGLVRFADLPGVVDIVARSLTEEGQLILVEPDHHGGMGGLLAGTVGALLPPCRGVHLGRDLSATLRAAGLHLTDDRRTTMPTMLWPLRRFATLRAVRTTDRRPSVGNGSSTSSADGAGSGSERKVTT